MAIDPNLHHTIIIPDMPKTFEAELAFLAERNLVWATQRQAEARHSAERARSLMNRGFAPHVVASWQDAAAEDFKAASDKRDLADFLKMIARFEVQRREGLEAQRQEMQAVKQRIAEGKGKTLGDLLEEALDELVSEVEAKHAVKH